MFLVIDLFLNVSALDEVRPRAAFYRQARYAAHSLSGEAYVEEDEIGEAVRSLARAPATTHDYVRLTGRAVVSEGRVSFGGEMVPMDGADLTRFRPPEGFAGTPLEWELLGRVSPRRVRDLCEGSARITPREERALLVNVRRRPDPTNAADLISLRRRIADAPRPLSEYSHAATAMVKRLRADCGQTPEEQRNFVAGPAGELAKAVLEVEIRRIKAFGIELDEGAWAGLGNVLLDLLGSIPELGESPPYTALMFELRRALEAVLKRAIEPRPGYRGGIEAVRLAARIGDEATRDVLLALIRERATVNLKFSTRPMRRDLVLLEIAMGSVIRDGTNDQKRRLAALIAEGLQAESEPGSRETWIGCAGRLLNGADPDIRAVLRPALEGARSGRGG